MPRPNVDPNVPPQFDGGSRKLRNGGSAIEPGTPRTRSEGVTEGVIEEETEMAKVKVAKVEKAVVIAEVMVEATVVVPPALPMHSGPAH